MMGRLKGGQAQLSTSLSSTTRFLKIIWCARSNLSHSGQTKRPRARALRPSLHSRLLARPKNRKYGFDSRPGYWFQVPKNCPSDLVQSDGQSLGFDTKER